MTDHTDPATVIDPAVVWPDRDRFATLDPSLEAVWFRYGSWDRTLFPNLVGVEIAHLRAGYCALRIAHRTELTNPEGVVHGGVLAMALDTVCVPAIGTYYDARPQMLTLQMNVNYIGALRDSDVFAQGWVTRGTRSVAFCAAEVRSDSGALVANATATFKVRL